jgi:hypothetical protein
VAKVECYLQFEPTWSHWDDVRTAKARGAKVVQVTQNPPTDLKGRRIAVRLSIDFPLELFEPPEMIVAEVTVPEPEDGQVVLRAHPEVVLEDEVQQ